MIYNNFVSNLAERFERRFSEISAHYNFDHGDEFEIALCESIRSVLPQKYGICRGFIVTKDNQLAGDDIIIYERDRFPTFKFLEQDKFDRKEDIPIESVCAYIEAKNTIYIEDDSGQSLAKALTQIESVKKLQRKVINRGTIEIDNQYCSLFASDREDWPQAANPIFTAIFARNIKISKKINTPPESIKKCLQALDSLSNKTSNNDLYPDIMIWGRDIIGFPCIRETKNGETYNVFSSPFFIKDKSVICLHQEPKKAFGLGVILLLYALDNIRLEKMQWNDILAHELGMELE
ncbi:MAG TPA: DUF6602 domain-containing protein [Nostocaceae cyanobacterium]|nr:DUF6602 domain-containing protein [Nostocaceae cyanobacterium]